MAKNQKLPPLFHLKRKPCTLISFSHLIFFFLLYLCGLRTLLSSVILFPAHTQHLFDYVYIIRIPLFYTIIKMISTPIPNSYAPVPLKNAAENRSDIVWKHCISVGGDAIKLQCKLYCLFAYHVELKFIMRFKCDIIIYATLYICPHIWLYVHIYEFLKFCRILRSPDLQSILPFPISSKISILTTMKGTNDEWWYAMKLECWSSCTAQNYVLMMMVACHMLNIFISTMGLRRLQFMIRKYRS